MSWNEKPWDDSLILISDAMACSAVPECAAAMLELEEEFFLFFLSFQFQVAQIGDAHSKLDKTHDEPIFTFYQVTVLTINLSSKFTHHFDYSSKLVNAVGVPKIISLPINPDKQSSSCCE